jgi:hypothetical protein
MRIRVAAQLTPARAVMQDFREVTAGSKRLAGVTSSCSPNRLVSLAAIPSSESLAVFAAQ